MRLSLTIEGLKEDVAALAALGDDATARAGERIAAALGPAATVRLLEVLGQAAVEVTSQLADGHAELRVAGDDASLVVVLEESSGPEPEPEPEPDAGGELSARLTLRLPEALKGRVESAADREGISTNTWVVRALGRAVAGVAAGPAGQATATGTGGGTGRDAGADGGAFRIHVTGLPGRRMRGVGSS